MTHQPALDRPQHCRYRFRGIYQAYLSAVTDQWLLVAPWANPAMLEMFADRDVRPYRNLVPWAGEFAGKYLTAAVQVLRATGDPALHDWLDVFVERLIGLQDTDGYVGPWPSGSHLTGRAPNVMGGGATWDAWGHYHVMLGLLLWHNETGDVEALAAVRRAGDLLCRTFVGTDMRIVDTGETDKNLAPVHVLAMLYGRTGEARYLDFARQIVEEFAAAGADGPLGGDYLQQALAGREFFEMPKPRWESLHPIMGLAELYWSTGEPGYREAFERIWWSIVQYDRHNNGGFSSGERATGNPYDPEPIETCCTIAWIATSVEMLKLTGNPVVADEIELSTLNSVLGMHSPSGRWATYNTPSDGARFASAHQIVFQARAGSPELNCCSVNSPRGLGMVSDWAVMVGADGVFLNYYGPMNASVRLHDGFAVGLSQATDYPVSGHICISVNLAEAATFAVNLRVPYWSTRTTIAVNGDSIGDVSPGTYARIERRWIDGDVIEVEMDMTPHFWSGDRDCAGLTSIYRGPVLLAYDQRYNRERQQEAEPTVFGQDPWKTTAVSLSVPPLNAATLDLEQVTWDEWMPPMLLLEAVTGTGERLRLCDFASAGQTGSLYRSWLQVDGAPERLPFSREHPLPSRQVPDTEV